MNKVALKEASSFIEELQEEESYSDLSLDHPHLLKAAENSSVNKKALLEYHERHGYTAERARAQFWDDMGVSYDPDGYDVN